MNNYVLIKFNANYSDEFDLESFWVTTEEDYDKFVKTAIKNKDNIRSEYYFGTNEAIYFEDVDDLLNSFEKVIISKEFAEGLLDHFGEFYGTFPIGYLVESILFDPEEDENT